jgi:hypothetical protein
MAAEIKVKKAGTEEEEINPFTRQERDRIIATYSNRIGTTSSTRLLSSSCFSQAAGHRRRSRSSGSTSPS